jgi:GTPase SAR1 family protein
VYDVTDKDSLTFIQRIYMEIKKKSLYHSCLVIVGNKCDLSLEERGEHQVTPKDTRELQKTISNRIQFYGVSAKEGTNVGYFFEDLLKKSLEKMIDIKKNSIQKILGIRGHLPSTNQRKYLTLSLIRESFNNVTRLVQEQEEEEYVMVGKDTTMKLKTKSTSEILPKLNILQ